MGASIPTHKSFVDQGKEICGKDPVCCGDVAKYHPLNQKLDISEEERDKVCAPFDVAVDEQGFQIVQDKVGPTRNVDKGPGSSVPVEDLLPRFERSRTQGSPTKYWDQYRAENSDGREVCTRHPTRPNRDKSEGQVNVGTQNSFNVLAETE